MRVLLIRPNSKWRHTYIPIGLGYLADAVRGAGHTVSILDARFERLSPEKVGEYIDSFKPEVVGLSAVHMPVEINGTRELARYLKQTYRDLELILGGPLASTLGESLVSEGLVEAAIVGEAEISFPKYLESLESNCSCDEVPGLIYKQNEEVIKNPRGEFVENLDELNIGWDLLSPNRYFSGSGLSNFSIIKKSVRSLPIFTSRGCPFRCIYCHNMFGKKFRARSAENVIDELSMLKSEYNIGEIEIVDDCFNLDLNRAKAIAQGIIERKLDIALSFPNGLRADRMDEELIDLLKEAGAYRIFYAVETGSPRLQKLIHKNVNLDRTKQIITYTANKGIMTCGFFMLGFPTETEEEMKMTVDYALRSKLHQAFFFYVVPFPGTNMAEKYVPADLQSNCEQAGYYVLHVNISEIPDEVLYRAVKSAYRRFHFSPLRIWRTLRVVPKNVRTLRAIGTAAFLGVSDMNQ